MKASQDRTVMARIGTAVQRFQQSRRDGATPLREPRDADESVQLERLAALAAGGYFHMSYVHDPFVFNAEIPLDD